jgi:glutathione peroxidase
MSFYTFKMPLINGEDKSFTDYEGQVVLVVNTATKCGLAGQFEGLETLHQSFKDEGLNVLGFPSNQFKNQEPGSNDDVAKACQVNFGVTFPLFAKIDVNGAEEAPLYTYLKNEKKGLLGRDIKWNFTKFLIGKDGTVLKRFAPQVVPEKLIDDIKAALAA